MVSDAVLVDEGSGRAGARAATRNLLPDVPNPLEKEARNNIVRSPDTEPGFCVIFRLTGCDGLWGNMRKKIS